MAYPYWAASYWPKVNDFYWPIRHYRYWPGDDGYQVSVGGVLNLTSAVQGRSQGADDSNSREVVVVKHIGYPRPKRVSYPK